MASRPVLPNALARRLFLTRHLLDACPDGTPKEATSAVIDRLGFVQVDSINTVSRAHDMILAARAPRYKASHLKTLLERDRVLWENWTHDAAVLPVWVYPYWNLRFERHAARLRAKWRDWHGPEFQDQLDSVLRQISDHGPAMARTVGEDEDRSSGGWWEWHPSKTALEYLWRTGALAISGRQGFQKVYDLTERVIPSDVLRTRVDEAEIIDWACRSALDRLGFATHGEIAAFWDLISVEEAKAWCARQNALISVDIEGADGTCRPAWTRPACLEDAHALPPLPGGVRVLSPFDPALRDRNRAERLFGFHYRIEVFVPAARRQYGYYVFPLIEGERLIGRIDMKRQGESGVVHVTAFWPEPGVRMGKERLRRIETALARTARFCGCGTVTFDDGWLRGPR